jgi:hypothetical protein
MIRIAFTVFVGTFLLSVSAIAACSDDQLSNSHVKAHQAKTRAPSNCLDLNAVPQISANIVTTERATPVKQPTYSLQTATPYEGPTLGVTKPDPGLAPVTKPQPAPTIGYRWQLQ